MTPSHALHPLRALAMALAVPLLLAACAPATRVTLLPRADGRASAVTVTTGQGTLLLDQAYQQADVRRDGALSTGQTSAESLRSTYPELLALQPLPPERFVLEFEPGTSQLTPDSQARLDTVMAQARARAGGEIVVTGHTDRQGSLEANDQLSLERAHAIRQLLVERGFRPELIDAVGRGEREPVVPTEDEVAEPRNRRAEILVR